MSLKITELFNVKNKVVIVTGGSRGIGKMISEGFVINGAKVYITARKVAQCEATATELSELGACIALPADLATTEGRAAFVDAIKQRESKIDVLVNNAGATWGAPYEEYPEDGYDKVMDINVKAIFMLTRDLLPLLEKDSSTGDPARVINVGSMNALKVSFQNDYAYGASKAAVHFLTQNLALRLASKGITFNAIAPGAFESKMMQWTLENYQSALEQVNPLGRIGVPGDIAGIAIYLASPAASYVNGAVIPVDGGGFLGSSPSV